MTSLVLAALLQVTLAVSDTPYEQALKKSEASGRPVLILIGADWCPYCKIVERDVMPKLKAQGLMDKVEYFYMDYDRDAGLVSKTLRGEIIPEMIMLTKTADGWKRADLSGGYKLAPIESFIKANLKDIRPAAEKKPQVMAPPADKAGGAPVK
jgi:thiol-disulfide isomerase/thioredoxin